MDTVVIVSLFLHIFTSHSLLKSLYDPLHLRHKRHRSLYLLLLVIVAAMVGSLHSIVVFSKVGSEWRPDLIMCYWVGQGLDTTLNATVFLIITILVAVVMSCCSAVAYYKYYLAMIVRSSKAYLDSERMPWTMDHCSLKQVCSIVRNSEVQTITSCAAQLTAFVLSISVFILVSVIASLYAIAGARHLFPPAAYLLSGFMLCLFTQMPFVLFFINAKLKKRILQPFCMYIRNRISVAFNEGENSNDNTFAVQGSGVLTEVPEYIMGMTLNSYNNLLRDLIVEDEPAPASQRSDDSGYIHNPIPIQEAWV